MSAAGDGADEAKLDRGLVAIAQNVKRLQMALPAMLELAALEGKIRRAKYDAYLANGFTPEQALELAKAPI